MGQEIDRDQILGRGRHRQDEGADRSRIAQARFAEKFEQLDEIAGLVRQIEARQIRRLVPQGRDEAMRPVGILRPLYDGPVDRRQDFGERAVHDGGVLADVEPHRVEAEDAQAPFERQDLARGRARRAAFAQGVDEDLDETQEFGGPRIGRRLGSLAAIGRFRRVEATGEGGAVLAERLP